MAYTKQHRANLLKLADYLDALPADYDRFKMSDFFRDADGWCLDPTELEGPHVPCGACACAIGHGPSAGIRRSPHDHSWDDYSERVFGTTVFDADGVYMFGAHHPDDPKAAAQRIREVVAQYV